METPIFDVQVDIGDNASIELLFAFDPSTLNDEVLRDVVATVHLRRASSTRLYSKPSIVAKAAEHLSRLTSFIAGPVVISKAYGGRHFGAKGNTSDAAAA